MSKEQKIKVGQIGVGGFGARRRQYLRESGLFELVACHDRNVEAMARCQAEEGAVPCSSYAELLAYPGLEAVIISTGAMYHADQAVAAMECGLHVFIEKPLCSTPGELEQIMAAQQRTGRRIGTGHHDHATDDCSATIWKLIHDGEIGKPVAFEVTTASSGGLAGTPDAWRFQAGRNPGGMLFQCGVHKIHELRYYFGEVRRVACLMRHDLRADVPVADSAVCTLEFVSGVYGTLHAHYVTPYRHTLNIFGTRANLYYENRYGHGGRLLTRQNLSAEMDGRFETRTEVGFIRDTDWCGNLRAFHRMVREGGDVYPGNRDAAAALAVVFAAEESARQGGAPVATGEFAV